MPQAVYQQYVSLIYMVKVNLQLAAGVPSKLIESL